MHGPNIAGAIAALASQLESALLRGDDTRSIRAEMAAVEQRQRTEAAEAAAEERARRAEAEEQEQAEINARATALLTEIKARIAETLAPLALSNAKTIRRYPDGAVEAVEINMEHEHG